jgi:HK97 family phage portal protein
LQSVQRSSSYNLNSSPLLPSVSLSPTYAATYEALYRSQPALRTVISFLARNIAQLGLDVFKKVNPNDRRRIGDHPVARLLERPLPGSKWTKYRLINTLIHELCIYDDAYWLKLYDNGVRGIVPIPAWMITPNGPSWFEPDTYVIRGNGQTQVVDAGDVVHFHGYNPSDPRCGVAPIESLRQILAEEYAAGSYREQMWRNGARVGGYIKRPKEAPKWSDTASRMFRADWAALYSGDGPNAGGTPVLEDGMEFVPSGVTPRDAQYVESRKLTREEVASAFHVSPLMVGLLDSATFNNVTQFHQMLYQDTLAPTLTQLAQDIECQLLTDFEKDNGKFYVEFNLNEKLRGSFAEQAQSFQSAVGGPWMTRAEARAMANLSEIDGADELIVPLNVVEGGLASPNDTAPNAPNNGPSNDQPDNGGTASAVAAVAVARHLTRQCAAVASKAGAGGSQYDAARWVKELSADLQLAGVDTEGAVRIARAVTADTGAFVEAAYTATDPAACVRRMYDALIARAERGHLLNG